MAPYHFTVLFYKHAPFRPTVPCMVFPYSLLNPLYPSSNSVVLSAPWNGFFSSVARWPSTHWNFRACSLFSDSLHCFPRGSTLTKAGVYPSPQMPPLLCTPVITDYQTLCFINVAVASIRHSMMWVTSCDITACHASSAPSTGLKKANSMHFQINNMESWYRASTQF